MRDKILLLSTPEKNAPRYFLNISRREAVRDLRFSPFEREMWEKSNETKLPRFCIG